ncbi:MAG: helix-turn-helix domain-containing protein [Desulfobacteraceae bacterium]|nr:helix-turn-helix domain-containing protein [Desulfobacteraceae bacterium]
MNEVAHLLHVHPCTVRRWEKQDQLKSYRLDPKGVIRFKREDVSNFIDPANKSQDGDGYGNFAKVALKGANSERYTG